MLACNEWGFEGEGHEGFVLLNLAIGEVEGYCMMFFMRYGIHAYIVVTK